jgi:hypothetical protein
MKCVLDSSVSGYGQAEGCCEHGNKLSGSVKFGKFLDQLSDIRILKNILLYRKCLEIFKGKQLFTISYVICVVLLSLQN